MSPRKTGNCPDMTETLLTGSYSINTKKEIYKNQDIATHTQKLEYKNNIRIYHECEGGLGKSIRGSLFGITRLVE